MELLAGTSGYSYREWKGSFYPDDLPTKDMLSHYATKLPTVEINNTFYRLPKANVLESWAEQVPEGFRFSIKASRRITHMKRLKDAGDETRYLLDIVRTLGDRLGVVLFQLPPNFKKNLERLSEFTELLAEDIPSVFEFRHDSWLDDEVYDMLRSAGCAICLSDVDDQPEPDLIPTTDWGYLRLRRIEYSDTQLKSWLKRIEAQSWNKAFVFFKHEDEATGPQLAQRLLELAS